jgi:hypothetical protein
MACLSGEDRGDGGEEAFGLEQLCGACKSRYTDALNSLRERDESLRILEPTAKANREIPL